MYSPISLDIWVKYLIQSHFQTVWGLKTEGPMWVKGCITLKQQMALHCSSMFPKRLQLEGLFQKSHCSKGVACKREGQPNFSMEDFKTKQQPQCFSMRRKEIVSQDPIERQYLKTKQDSFHEWRDNPDEFWTTCYLRSTTRFYNDLDHGL